MRAAQSEIQELTSHEYKCGLVTEFKTGVARAEREG